MKKITPVKDVIIIGAGAAGMMCGAECGKRGRTVLVIDHAEKAGKKILVSGGGRSNFTNIRVSDENYISGNPHFVRSALSSFTQQDFLDLIGQHGISWEEREYGRLFCRESASRIVTMLEKECSQVGVGFSLGTEVLKVEKADFFRLTTSKEIYQAQSLVVATGGLTWPQIGSTAFAYDTAEQFGINVVSPSPALVPFVYRQEDAMNFSDLSGISLPAHVSCGGKTFLEDILFTHKGLSGPAILQASSYWEKENPVVLDFLPGTDTYDLFTKNRELKIEMKTFLSRSIPKRLSEKLCGIVSLPKTVNKFSNKEYKALSALINSFRIVPQSTEGFDAAEATRGGVDTRELSSRTMESRKIRGLFFIGEAVDVTGQLGGYNLQWAWSSGYAAGQHA
jgi:predicted Rossmann fold flavoprotein